MKWFQNPQIVFEGPPQSDRFGLIAEPTRRGWSARNTADKKPLHSSMAIFGAVNCQHNVFKHFLPLFSPYVSIAFIFLKGMKGFSKTGPTRNQMGVVRQLFNEVQVK